MKIKLPHFLPYPGRVLTRQERIIQRRWNQMDLRFAWFYALFLLLVFSVCSIGSLFASRNDEKEARYGLYSKICQERKDSSFCTDKKLYDKYYDLSLAKWVPPGLVFGIMFAESSLHTNYNKPHCKDYNNPFGLKWYKRDNWKLDWYPREKHWADKNGCWLYKFETLEEWLNWLLNTISIWYKGCKMSTRCISYNYVGKPDVAEESWIKRVSLFYEK